MELNIIESITLESNVDLKPNWTNNVGLCNVKKNNVCNDMWICINVLVNDAEVTRNKQRVEVWHGNEQCRNTHDKLHYVDLRHV